jgi:hypothetical protein
MAMTSSFDDSAPTISAEVVAMAAVMEGKHGQYAAEVAEFFALWHDQKGDHRRSEAWFEVADHLRQREFFRSQSECDASGMFGID